MVHHCFSGANATFIAEMQQAWQQDPSSVPAEWAEWFEMFGAFADTAEYKPSWCKEETKIVGAHDPDIDKGSCPGHCRQP